MVALEENSGITKVSRLPPLGTMNTCTKCHSYQCDLFETYRNDRKE